jgi:hypothetical protein
MDDSSQESEEAERIMMMNRRIIALINYDIT